MLAHRHREECLLAGSQLAANREDWEVIFPFARRAHQLDNNQLEFSDFGCQSRKIQADELFEASAEELEQVYSPDELN